MPHESTSDHSPSEQEQDDPESEFAEVDPTGRYGRYKEVLGRGAFKKVYKAFDELEGIEVAWNQVRVADLLRNSEDLEHLYSEVHLLKTLKHKHIIKFYNSWVDTKNENINFITEIFTSGTLRQYRKKHKHVDLRALKKWSKQILEGLFYLHSHDPPVIHRDLKCDNIFVNGNQGEVKIGDLGLAVILHQARSAHSVIGTPEFMAPELYEEDYNELVDIYAFGMCLLELVTCEYPYIECNNAAQIYKKVTSGIKPASLAKVKDPSVRAFIEKCIAKVPGRLSAKDLLMDPFLRADDENESLVRSLLPKDHHSGGSSKKTDLNAKDSSAELSSDFTVQGQSKGVNTIFVKLRIVDSSGNVHNIHFPFGIEVDTALAVASEMVEELDLTDQDVATIADMIESQIRSHIPDWKPLNFPVNNVGGEVAVTGSPAFEGKDDDSILPGGSSLPPGILALERLPSGRKYWCDSPKALGGSSPSKLGLPNSSFHEQNADSSSEKLEGENLSDEETNNEENKLQPEDKNRASLDAHVESESYHAEGSSRRIGDNESEVKEITEKIQDLLMKQQMELEELKRRHALAITALLNQVSPEIKQEVLNRCRAKLPIYKLL